MTWAGIIWYFCKRTIGPLVGRELTVAIWNNMGQCREVDCGLRWVSQYILSLSPSGTWPLTKPSAAQREWTYGLRLLQVYVGLRTFDSYAEWGCPGHRVQSPSDEDTSVYWVAAHLPVTKKLTTTLRVVSSSEFWPVLMMAICATDISNCISRGTQRCWLQMHLMQAIRHVPKTLYENKIFTKQILVYVP